MSKKHCEFCDEVTDHKVIQSKLSDRYAYYRRIECKTCQLRATTYEIPDSDFQLLLAVKSDLQSNPSSCNHCGANLGEPERYLRHSDRKNEYIYKCPECCATQHRTGL